MNKIIIGLILLSMILLVGCDLGEDTKEFVNKTMFETFKVNASLFSNKTNSPTLVFKTTNLGTNGTWLNVKWDNHTEQGVPYGDITVELSKESCHLANQTKEVLIYKCGEVE